MNGDLPTTSNWKVVQCGINPPAPNKGVKLKFKFRKSAFPKVIYFPSKPNYSSSVQPNILEMIYDSG